MIRLLGDMPAGVLGLEAVDDVEKEDYENVIVPAVNQALTDHGKVRLVYVLGPEFDDYEGEAVWEDLKLGARNPASFERIAIVTDARWAGPAIKLSLSVCVPVGHDRRVCRRQAGVRAREAHRATRKRRHTLRGRTGP